MPLPFAAFFAGKKAAEIVKKLALPALVLAVVVVVLLLAYCAGGRNQHTKDENRRLEANQDMLQNKSRADERGAEQREADTNTIAQQREELRRVQNNPNVDANTRRIMRGCSILRQQGKDTSRIPGCARIPPNP